MKLMPPLFPIERLARMLGRNRRTVARALEGTPPDGKSGRHPGWHLETARTALDRHERATGRGNGGGADDASLHASLRALEIAGQDVESALQALRAERDVKRRRKLLRELGFGNLLIRLELAFAATFQTQQDHQLFGPFANQQIKLAFFEALTLCEIRADERILRAGAPSP
jgi:hypothetical protein